MTLSQPLVPAFVDLTDFEFMPLSVRRLRDSRIVALVNGDEFRAAVLLWAASWHQVPCGSLPTDDIELAHLAGFGRVLGAWQDVKVGALHGWVLCADGRLYHPVIAEKAIEGWNAKQRHAWQKECDRVRKENKRRTESGEPLLPTPAKPSRVGMDLVAPEKLVPDPSAGTEPFSDGKPLVSARKPKDGDDFPAENALKGQGEVRDIDLICPKPAKPVRTRQTYPDDFEDFWKRYPTDRLMSKAETLKVWKKLSEDDRASATAAIPGFVSYCRNNPTYRAVHAVRFLSQRRFDGFAPTRKPTLTVVGQIDAEPMIELRNGHRRSVSDVRDAVARWRESHRTWKWHEMGPEPGKDGCLVPVHLLQEAGIAPPTAH